MGKIHELSGTDFLEIIECLLNIGSRKEAEIAEIKAQLDIFRPKDASMKIIETPSHNIKGKILIVFQSKTLRDILRTLLTKSDQFDVASVDRCEDAPSACALSHPDVCVFEISKLNNLSAQIDILRDTKNASEKTALITVLYDNDVSLIREVVTAGSDDFLVKPIDTSRMIKVITDILARKINKVAV